MTGSTIGALQQEVNRSAWRDGDFVEDYAGRALTPAEIILLSRYHGPLSGRTVEFGCGAGRVLSYLAQLGAEANGVDLSPLMVDYCRRTHPRAHVRVGDLADPHGATEGRYDAVWATNNVLDVFDDAERRRILGELADLVGSNGVLIFSSHNLDAPPGPPAGWREAWAGPWTSARALGALRRAAWTTPGSAIRRLRSEPERRRNRRRLEPYTFRADGYAVFNDDAHDYRLLHYYIRRDDQERQLAEAGYRLIECLDHWGDRVPAGAVSLSPELHYVAYPR